MRQFFKMMFAATFGVFIALMLTVLLVFSVITAMLMSMSSESKLPYTPRYDESVFKLSLNGFVLEDVMDDPLTSFLGENNTLSLKDVIASIRNAKNQNTIKGMYLDVGLFFTGSANVEAIRRELVDFQERGKFIVAYADQYTQAGYTLASVADEIYLNPQGTLALTGFASSTLFYKGLLEKIGIDMMVFKVGKYKGAVEPFLGDKLSDENREQISVYQQEIWNGIVNDISRSRHISASDVNHFADEGLFLTDPINAIECGLIDDIQYRSDVENMIKEKAGQTGASLQTIGVAKMKRAKTPVREYRNKIAIIYAEGEILGVPVSLSSGPIITEELTKELKKLNDDDNVKAVVLRINSPGGSAYVSEQIWKQIIDLKKTKPVVVSMGNVAASGGYYISCAASKIVAEKSTLTGSIGIFGLFPNATGLFDKLSLTSDVVKTNRFADIGDPSRLMTPEEQILIQSSVERGYDTFLSRCAQGRNKSKEEIDEIGQGRIWTGQQARELGLVDELGGIDHAVEIAVKLSGVVNYTLVPVSSSKGFFKDLIQKQLEETKINMLKNGLGNEYEYFKILQQIKTAYGIQARLPYDFKPL
ncbi:MAG: signal peptide peptidase SppA [Tannerella sp.]|jgi:protease-4|nr:signal peptide peptidase SppA [Tannerella sp.]